MNEMNERMNSAAAIKLNRMAQYALIQTQCPTGHISPFRADCSMLRLACGFTNHRLTLTPGLTSRAF